MLKQVYDPWWQCTRSVRSHSMRKWNERIWWCQGAAAAAKHECCIQPFLNNGEKNLTHLNGKATIFSKVNSHGLQWISYTYENSRIPKSSRWKMSWCPWGLIVQLNDVQSWWNGYKDPSFEVSFLVFVLGSWHLCKVSVPHQLVWAFFMTHVWPNRGSEHKEAWVFRHFSAASAASHHTLSPGQNTWHYETNSRKKETVFGHRGTKIAAKMIMWDYRKIIIRWNCFYSSVNLPRHTLN